MVSGEQAPDSDVAQVISDVMEWLETQSDDLSSVGHFNPCVMYISRNILEFKREAAFRCLSRVLSRKMSLWIHLSHVLLLGIMYPDTHIYRLDRIDPYAQQLMPLGDTKISKKNILVKG